jgi:hypothetical protein
MAKKANGPIVSAFKLGFGAGLGLLLSKALFFLVAMATFIPGFIMYKNEKKKSKDQQSTTTIVIGLVLMGLGCVLGFGFGTGIFFGSVVSEFE